MAQLVDQQVKPEVGGPSPPSSVIVKFSLFNPNL